MRMHLSIAMKNIRIIPKYLINATFTKSLHAILKIYKSIKFIRKKLKTHDVKY